MKNLEMLLNMGAKIKNEPIPIVGDGEQKRDFIHVMISRWTH